MQLRNFLEELFAKAVVLNLHGSELCIYSRVSCSDMMAGVNADEVELATILSTMDVRRTSLLSYLHPFVFLASGHFNN